MITKYLQAKTDIAHSTGKQKIRNKRLTKEEKDQRTFLTVAKSFLDKVEASAGYGCSSEEVTAIYPPEYCFPHGGNYKHLKEEWLRGTGKLLFDYLKLLGLRPTIGISTRHIDKRRFALFAHWEKEFQERLDL